ncbi:unnamed protein product [Mytilus coruscus]|uniref:Ig-like domain-containing protein n=1 Tax=Mytilus coruscus TaxID=42192 RepID=A0A6J8EMS7_MYTCO|nr:unnamed protein product [Mytilus coruscus]
MKICLGYEICKNKFLSVTIYNTRIAQCSLLLSKSKTSNFELDLIEHVRCNSSATVSIYCKINKQVESGFAPWIHSYNGIFIRYLKGDQNNTCSIISIDSCALEDTGQYFCRAWVKELSQITWKKQNNESEYQRYYAAPGVSNQPKVYNDIQIAVVEERHDPQYSDIENEQIYTDKESSESGCVNAVNPSHISRSVADCKKKWQGLHAATKKKEATRRSEARATGGGPPPVCNFKPWESTVKHIFLLEDDQEIQVKFLKMEEEKKEDLKTYRQKKIELLEKNVLATEKIADNLAKILDSLSNTQIITYENEK